MECLQKTKKTTAMANHTVHWSIWVGCVHYTTIYMHILTFTFEVICLMRRSNFSTLYMHMSISNIIIIYHIYIYIHNFLWYTLVPSRPSQRSNIPSWIQGTHSSPSPRVQAHASLLQCRRWWRNY